MVEPIDIYAEWLDACAKENMKWDLEKQQESAQKLGTHVLDAEKELELDAMLNEKIPGVDDDLEDIGGGKHDAPAEEEEGFEDVAESHKHKKSRAIVDEEDEDDQ